MDNMNAFLKGLELDNKIALNDIPEIDLYMDQVIQLFESKFTNSKRNQDEKVLTKTMINNYAKGKLFFPIKNKKYTKQHLILISMIYQLKGALSINDIKALLDPINEQIMAGNFPLEELYGGFLKISDHNIDTIADSVNDIDSAARDEIKKFEDMAGGSEQLEQFLLIASLAHMSNIYRRAAEKLVDQYMNTYKE